MGYPAIDDAGLVDALVDGVGHAVDLGDHAAGNNTLVFVAFDLAYLHTGDEGALVILIPQQAGNIGHAHQLFGLEGDCNAGGGGIGVDVVGHAVFIHAQGGDHRDKGVIQQVGDEGGIHIVDLPHIAQVRVALAAACDHLTIHAAKAHAPAPQQGHQVLVHFPGQHLLHHPHGHLVGVAQPVHKPALMADGLEGLIDGGAAPVHQHHPYPQKGQGDQIVHNGAFQLLVDHGVAAVFDHHGGAVVLLDIRRGLAEELGHLFVFHAPCPLSSVSGETGPAYVR